MTVNCNGCGKTVALPAAVYAYGAIESQENVAGNWRTHSRHRRTLCPRCHVVMKDILLRSNLSDHWDEYDWEGMDAAYTEPYNES